MLSEFVCKIGGRYTLLGLTDLPPPLSLPIDTAVGLGVYAAMRGGSEAKVATPVTAPAGSSCVLPSLSLAVDLADARSHSDSGDEADFIKNFIANLEKEDAAAAKH